MAAQSNTFSSRPQLNSESSLLPSIYGIPSLINSCQEEKWMKLHEKIQ
jgi:hypothetical protein